jgi:hypothetical protein
MSATPAGGSSLSPVLYHGMSIRAVPARGF